MKTSYWITRAAAAAAGLYFFMGWHGIGAPWPGLITWLLCTGGAELIVEVSRKAEEASEQ